MKYPLKLVLLFILMFFLDAIAYSAPDQGKNDTALMIAKYKRDSLDSRTKVDSLKKLIEKMMQMPNLIQQLSLLGVSPFT